MNGSLARSLGNEHYRGHAFAWLFLLAMGSMNLFRGSIHLFKADGGAASIAGIDLSLNGEVILSLFAGMGLAQLLMAAIDFAVALRFRALVPLLVGYHALNQLGVALIAWWWRPIPLEAPGKYGAVALIPLVLLALWAATRRGEASARATAPLAERAG